MRSARIALFVLAAFNIPIGSLFLAAVATGVDDAPGVTSGTLLLACGLAALFLAARFRTGGAGIQYGAVALALIIVIYDVIGLVMDSDLPLSTVVFAAPILLGCLGKEGAAWFASERD
ncbi:hypothetical protein AB0K09_31815 [Streptomyces sp. NPDC049577]|uniref:hypothetical protein n=1 Tax=Streptomyces sp. NPDC049577 TaxID=3155153 RepID=UPI00343BA853